MSNGENGFLTERDKAFLQTDGDYYTGENAKNQRYETREVIAERARQAFHDFALLNDVLDKRERDRIFDPDDEISLMGAVWDTIAFLYHSLEGDVGDDPWILQDRSVITGFDSALKTGVQRGESNRHPPDANILVSVEFDVYTRPITTGTVDWEQVIEGLAENDVNAIDEQDLRTAISLAANSTDRLHDLADLVEEKRGSRYHPDDAAPLDPEEVADEARTLSELIDERSDEAEE